MERKGQQGKLCKAFFHNFGFRFFFLYYIVSVERKPKLMHIIKEIFVQT